MCHLLFLQIVERLLIAAVADAEVSVRHSIFSALHGDRSFDDFLAQADSLSAVFAALNDEVRCCIYLLVHASLTIIDCKLKLDPEKPCGVSK